MSELSQLSQLSHPEIKRTPPAKEVKEFVAPFFRKKIDLEEVRERIGKIEGKLQDNPEWAGVLAKRLFGELVEGSRFITPLGRDQRNVFEVASYIEDRSSYIREPHQSFIKIVTHGLPQDEAERLLESVFGEDTRGNYDAMNFSLRRASDGYILEHGNLPDWVKEMDCFKGIF